MTISSDGYLDGGEPYTDEEMEIINDEEDYTPYPDCPICGNISGFMGWLGNLNWFRCMFCGMEFSTNRD